VLRIESILGEGPVWSEDEQALYWLDVFLSALNRFDPAVGINKAMPLDRPIYVMALRSPGGAVGAFEDGVGFVGLDGGTIEVFGDPKAGSPAGQTTRKSYPSPGRSAVANFQRQKCCGADTA
jgi:sugar lactone lactonase YvrE